MKISFSFILFFSFLLGFSQTEDFDGDGILDKDDMCPKVFGAIINRGCPWPDTDGDGVLDKDDRCPNIFGDVKWEGCPNTDDDGDGVPNVFDSCLELKGNIDNKGCPPLKGYEKLYYKSQKNKNFDQLGDLIFSELELNKLKSNIILLYIFTELDLSIIPCGSSEEEITRSEIESNIIQKLFWKANFEKLLNKESNKIIIPIQSSRNSIFIDKHQLKNLIPINKLQKNEGNYLIEKKEFYVFNSKNNSIVFKDKDDIYKKSDKFKISIYIGKKTWVSIMSSNQMIEKNIYFKYENGTFEKISQKENFNN